MPGEPDVSPSPEPTPNWVPTAMVDPSALTSMLDGYHPVGMSPLKIGERVPLATSYTATAFTPPSAT